jgi:hypothetical protein
MHCYTESDENDFKPLPSFSQDSFEMKIYSGQQCAFAGMTEAFSMLSRDVCLDCFAALAMTAGANC